MKVNQDTPEMYGEVGEHLSGSVAYDEAKHGAILPCPFCGNEEVEVSSTHTPYYTIICGNCECEMPGLGADGAGGHIKTVEQFNEMHDYGIKSAVEWWNMRSHLPSTPETILRLAKNLFPHITLEGHNQYYPTIYINGEIVGSVRFFKTRLGLPDNRWWDVGSGDAFSTRDDAVMSVLKRHISKYLKVGNWLDWSRA